MPTGLKTHYVLFVIDLKTRVVNIAGITTAAGEAFMAQVARNLTDHVDGFLRSHPRADSRSGLEVHGRVPAHAQEHGREDRAHSSPSAQQQRVCRTLRADDQVQVPQRDDPLQGSVVAPGDQRVAEHYHIERAHQGIGNELIEKSEPGRGDIECLERLGGMLKSYRRAA